MKIEQTLEKLGLELPKIPKPTATYVPAVKAGDIVFSSGHSCRINGKLKYRGKVGKELSIEEGYESAKIAMLNCLSAIKSVIGSLDKIERIIKVTGFVNSASGFDQQSAIINGASHFLERLFGGKGQHARTAIGVNELPGDAPVEIEVIIKIRQ